MIALLWLPAAALAQDEFEHTRILDVFQPAMVEDASPIPVGFQVDSSVAARAGEGDDDELQVRPAFRYGVIDTVSVSVATEVSLGDDQQGEFGGVDVEGQWQLLDRPDLVDLAVIAAVGTPSSEAGPALEAGLLLTETIERTRIHANGRFRSLVEAEDEWILAGGLDYVVGERVLLLGDAYLREEDSDVFPGADLGVSWRAGESFRIQGAAGLLAPDEDLHGQFVIAISSHG